MAKDCDPRLIETVLTAATNVHRVLDAGLLESVYEKALLRELQWRAVPAETQVPIPVFYKGIDLGVGIRVGYILNFNCRLLKHGIKRVSLFSSTP